MAVGRTTLQPAGWPGKLSIYLQVAPPGRKWHQWEPQRDQTNQTDQNRASKALKPNYHQDLHSEPEWGDRLLKLTMYVGPSTS